MTVNQSGNVVLERAKSSFHLGANTVLIVDLTVVHDRREF